MGKKQKLTKEVWKIIILAFLLSTLNVFVYAWVAGLFVEAGIRTELAAFFAMFIITALASVLAWVISHSRRAQRIAIYLVAVVLAAMVLLAFILV